jgi:hypothetical protein
MLETCGPFAINHECSVLQQMLKRIERWPERSFFEEASRPDAKVNDPSRFERHGMKVVGPPLLDSYAPLPWRNHNYENFCNRQ